MPRFAVHHTRRVHLRTIIDAATQAEAEQKVADAVLSSLGADVEFDELLAIDGSDLL